MRTILFLSLWSVLSLITLSPFTPALAFRGKLPTDFLKSDSPFPVSDRAVVAPIRHDTSSSSSSSSSGADSSSSSSASASMHVDYPLNLTVPFSVAPSTWSIRYLDGTYYRVENNTLGDRVQLSVSDQWSAADVSARLQQLVGDDDQWKKQQKALKRHVKRSNWLYSTDDDDCNSASSNSSSCAVPVHGGDSKHKDGKHDKHHDKHHDKKDKSLMSFYLRQSQCRACVQHNSNLLNELRTARLDSSDALSWLPSYAPAAVMKFCTLSTPKLAAEQSPAISAAPLADWEGVCVPAEVECPSATLDMSILSPSTCAADEPVTKQSCTLCILDGYTWQTGKRAFKNADNYAGQCVDPTKAASVPSYHDRTVLQLDSCPSAVYSVDMAYRYNMLAMSFGGFMSVVGLLFFCICLRACCIARKNRQSALLRVTRASAAAAPAVPSVSSSPSPSAPPAAGYPAAMAVAQEHQEPLLSSGLNPPNAWHAVSAYPQLYAQQVAVAQPAYAYGRL